MHFQLKKNISYGGSIKKTTEAERKKKKNHKHKTTPNPKTEQIVQLIT